MADTIYAVSSGFFDSVDKDRLYSADDMNKPYSEIISEGVFSASNDFKVTPGSGLAVIMAAGTALIGGKWLKAGATTIAVPQNTTLYPRIDSVILRMDVNVNTRAGQLIYRTGTPASTPSTPALVTSAGITEFRIANVTVAAGASSISSANISDQRGSSDCPYANFKISEAQIQGVLMEIIGDHPEYIVTVPDGGITTVKLADGAVTLAKIGAGVIDNSLSIPGRAADAKAVGNAVLLHGLADGTDLNDVQVTSVYYMASTRNYLNNPAEAGHNCILYVTSTSANGTDSDTVQLLVLGAWARIYVRVKSNSSETWGNWHSNLDDTLKVSGLAADAKIVGDAILLRALADETDLNDVKATGIYNMAASRSYDNIPVASGHNCTLFVISESVDGLTGSAKQFLIELQSGKLFNRIYSSAEQAWSAWNVNLFDVLKSRFYGKKFSILGDSVETYDRVGYKLPDYRMYYPHTGNDVDDVTKTWWDIVIINSGGSLDVNASWSGSLASNNRAEDGYPDFYDRVGLLGDPDVIFVALGSNDSTRNVDLGDYDFETEYESLSESTFRTAYIKGVKALQALYPGAQIVCLAEIMTDEYAESIEHIAKTLGVEFVDVRGYDASSDPNLRHPNFHGMQQIASWVMFPTDKHLWQDHYPADAKVVGAELKLLNDEIPNTVQTYTFTDGSVSKVEHTNGSDIIRTDTFTYGTNTITETRTLNSGEVLTIVTNLTTLQTTVTYTN